MKMATERISDIIWWRFKCRSSGLWDPAVMWEDTSVSEDPEEEAARPSETLVSYHITTRRHISEDRDLNVRLCFKRNGEQLIHSRVLSDVRITQPIMQSLRLMSKVQIHITYITTLVRLLCPNTVQVCSLNVITLLCCWHVFKNKISGKLNDSWINYMRAVWKVRGLAAVRRCYTEGGGDRNSKL